MKNPPLTEIQFRRNMKAMFGTRKGASKASVRRRIDSMMKKVDPDDPRFPMLDLLKKQTEAVRQR